MEILYGKNFSKDLDAIRHGKDIKAHLLKLIETIRAAKSFSHLKGARKIEGYQA
jgi:hypothetical protein